MFPQGLVGAPVARDYPGLGRGSLSPGVRAELLLAQIQRAVGDGFARRRLWQLFEPLSAYLDPEIWPDEQSVLQDLSYAKLAIEILSKRQRQELERALGEMTVGDLAPGSRR